MSGASTTDASSSAVPQIKKKRPRDNQFTQQNLTAWQPTMAPLYVAVLFFIIFVIFTAIGTVLIITTQDVQEYIKDYTDNCDPSATPDVNGAPICNTTDIEFTITKTMVKPYLYYYLENFYQNHRRYSVSRSDTQLGGKTISASSAQSSCSPIFANIDTSQAYDVNTIPTTQVYSPCGLIAWSMFNDTISLYKKSDNSSAVTLICDGARPLGSADPRTDAHCTKDGIAWFSDKSVKYLAPENAAEAYTYPNYYFNETGHQLPNTTDEDFMVWMRTAALPSFRKLYRIITIDLEPGTYYFSVISRYPVKGFGGRKKVILTTTSVFGGKNLFLSIAYFVVAGICAVLSVVFLIAGIIQKVKAKIAHRKRMA